MSQENVEVARRAFAAFNAGDMDQLRDLYHPDAISRPPPGWPVVGPLVGRDAIMQEFTNMRETWDDTDSVEALGDFLSVADRVVVRMVWKGAGHGPAMNMQMTQVATVRRGLIFDVEYFWDHDEALEAVGLRE